MGREQPVIAIKGNGSKQSPIRSTKRILMNMCIKVRLLMCAQTAFRGMFRVQYKLNICDNYTIISKLIKTNQVYGAIKKLKLSK